MESREGSDQALHLPGGGPAHPRIIGICFPFPGVTRVFEEGRKLGLWDFVPMAGGRLSLPPADVYMLGAWHPDYHQMLNLGGKTGVLWTSSVGEMDFAPVEWRYLYQLLEDPRVAFIWFGCEALAKLFLEKGFYAPYPLAPVEAPVVAKQDIMTLFCPGGPKKNLGNTLAAVALVQRERPELVLHSNVKEYEPVMQFLGISYVIHDWLPREDYYRLLASARCNLAVSLAETYSYQTAEALQMGTVSVISETIPLPGVVVSNPNEPQLIALGIQNVLALPAEEIAKARLAMETQAQQNNEELARVLNSRLA